MNSDTDDRFCAGLEWYALQTKPRYEHLTNLMLRNKGYESFLPVKKVRKRWSDRYKELQQALFPGYVFCRFDVYQRLPILITPGVSRIVGVGRTPCPVPDSEIAALRLIEESGLNYEPWPFLKAGQRVRIESGPLQGLEGLLVEVKSRRRLVVSVTLLQRSVGAEVDSADVTPLEGLQVAYREMRQSAARPAPAPVPARAAAAAAGGWDAGFSQA
ncbi:MAG: UpxY family transcription antiterminator [Bryobacterales bacterium]|nr:UpxY family transcription antiterminator [Bryobacterales bacterium]